MVDEHSVLNEQVQQHNEQVLRFWQQLELEQNGQLVHDEQLH